jgi:D-beta-D-heptose 7-phosphate kinase/D-beta-D-heptose 1-phosphate adenosyltransferase
MNNPIGPPDLDRRHVSALVLGDVMLDRYISGHVRRISPEAPVPVVALEGEWCNPGGAGHTAASLAGLGCRVTLAAAVGRDDEAGQLRKALAERQVAELILLGSDASRTICKTRVVSGGQHQLLRLDRDGSRDGLQRCAAELERAVLPLVGRHDVVVISDYDKGTVTEGLARAVIAECRRTGVPCVVDPKRPDFSSYAGATVLTPNVMEAQRALGRSLDGEAAIEAAAVEMRVVLGLDQMVVTRGAEGMTLATAEGVFHFAAEVREVADVSGAGDTVVAVLASSLARGTDVEEACRLASVAAGIAVGHRGAYVVQATELENALRVGSPKLLDWHAARRRAAAARESGRRVVFTNGCFDILHAGHLSCLTRAKQLGDLLIVGLNSDASVRLNKGDSRPIITEGHRASLLAGLACVDAVVLFDELTPERLIRHVEPDVLVKGGDYDAASIAGADFVRDRGGQVVTLPLVEGLSTTRILAASNAHDRSGDDAVS